MAKLRGLAIVVVLVGCRSEAELHPDGFVPRHDAPVDTALAIDSHPRSDGAIDGAVDARRADAGSAVDGGSAQDAGSDLDAGPAAAATILISEVKTRGTAGAADEFIEIYNAGSGSATLDASWTLTVRSAVSSGTTYAVRFTGSGQTIGADHHLLVTGTGYTSQPAGDATFSVGIPDAASVVLQHGATVADAVCFYFNTSTENTLTTGSGYTCEGTPVQNPHDNTTSTNTDASLERKPGGAGGNGTHSGDNASDFAASTPSNPQALASAPTP